jgi:uncharacterized membrane protein YoaK (UPF0700 family)
LQSIARLSSQNFFKIFARLAKHSQTKLLAIRGSPVVMFVIKAFAKNAIRKKVWRSLGLLLLPVSKED